MVARMKKTAKAVKKYPLSLHKPEIVDGLKWLPGVGPSVSRVVIVLDKPESTDIRAGRLLTGQATSRLLAAMRSRSMDAGRTYITTAVKFIPPGGKSAGATHMKMCAECLAGELESRQPQLVVCMGALALKAVVRGSLAFSSIRGTVVPDPLGRPFSVLALHSPGAILRDPSLEDVFLRELETAARFGTTVHTGHAPPEYTVIDRVTDLAGLRDALAGCLHDVCIDCEWHGETWMHPDRYIRTVQMRIDRTWTVIVELFDEGTVKGGEWTAACARQVIDDLPRAWELLKEILENPLLRISGHNIVADAEWLASYGVDILRCEIYDTMLAEHTINPATTYDLIETMKRRLPGRPKYDIEVAEWIRTHPEETRHGFGAVPRNILFPYAALDVEIPAEVEVVQRPLLLPYMEPRESHPSLFDTVLETAKGIAEMETHGLLLDRERFDGISRSYVSQREKLHSRLVNMAAEHGIVPFNPRSNSDLEHMLFTQLKLQPVKTTSGKPWSEVMHQPEDMRGEYSACMDKTVLDILQDEHPFVKTMRLFRKLDTVYKFHLDTKSKADCASKGGGTLSKVWPDGRLRSHFSQMAETARFKSSRPNIQNWPKKAEGCIAEAFDFVNVPPLLRTSIVPSYPGWVFTEADYTQAELFMLAWLSGDAAMWKVLTTPGLDMHDATGVTSFRLEVLDASGRSVEESRVIEMATRDKAAFKRYRSGFIYVDQKGRRLSRAEFENSLRIGAKGVNFGICYGRGAEAIALQVKAETGTEKTVSELTEEIAEVLQAWKSTLYPVAWEYLTSCADAVEDPGYLVNPWGRKREFGRAMDRTALQAMRREAQNWNIQSGVADTVQLAISRIRGMRSRPSTPRFDLVAQFHDALMVAHPGHLTAEVHAMLRDAMGGIDIPADGGGKPLRLAADIATVERWGEKE